MFKDQIHSMYTVKSHLMECKSLKIQIDEHEQMFTYIYMLYEYRRIIDASQTPEETVGTSARPGKGRPKLDIPLEMVGRLEQLVELADRVESKRRTWHSEVMFHC